MNRVDPFRDLRFAARPRIFGRIPRRIGTLGLALAAFSLLWVILPPSAFFWLMLPVVAVLVWAASYGWQQTLSVLIEALQHLEQM